MLRNEDGFTVVELVGVFMAVLILSLNVMIFWGLGSLVTSGIKAAKGECAVTYGIEKVVQGDWFCPEEK